MRIVFDCSSHQKGKATLNDCLETAHRSSMTFHRCGSDYQNTVSSLISKKPFYKSVLKNRTETPHVSSGYKIQKIRTVLCTFIIPNAYYSALILRSAVYHHLQTHDSEIAADITHNIYVDNICVGGDSTDQAVRFYKESRQMMADGNFNLRSWSTNCPEVQKLAEGDKVLDNTDSVNIICMQWKIKPDELTFHQKSIDTHDLTVTKRLILQRTSRLYDPLSILCPVSIKARMLLQRLWKDSIDWDTPLNTDFVAEWKCLSNDISKAAMISVPRCIFNENIKNSTVDIHMFGDASSKAYGTAAYIRYGDASHLLIAKSRVALIKLLTIPQLELLAATITARLHAHVVNKINSFLWSDSQIVLGWIRSDQKLPLFVSNRVAEIRKLTQVTCWNYCPTTGNPADLLTRGLSTEELTNNRLWFNGPSWITNEQGRPQSSTINHIADVHINTCPITEDKRENDGI